MFHFYTPWKGQSFQKLQKWTLGLNELIRIVIKQMEIVVNMYLSA